MLLNRDYTVHDSGNLRLYTIAYILCVATEERSNPYTVFLNCTFNPYYEIRGLEFLISFSVQLFTGIVRYELLRTLLSRILKLKLRPFGFFWLSGAPSQILFVSAFFTSYHKVASSRPGTIQVWTLLSKGHSKWK